VIKTLESTPRGQTHWSTRGLAKASGLSRMTMKTAFSMLGPTSQTAYAEELERLWSEHNEDENGKTITQNEYLEVIGTRL
jgi:hypothetical protein